MSFKDMVSADIKGVFLNSGEFAELRTVKYNGNTYTGIPVVLSGLREKERSVDDSRMYSKSHDQGFYLVQVTLHCSLEDIGGALPEQGMRISVDDDTGFFHEFRVASSWLEMGMVRCRLQVIDE